jgi:hypothetical protein
MFSALKHFIKRTNRTKHERDDVILLSSCVRSYVAKNSSFSSSFSSFSFSKRRRSNLFVQKTVQCCEASSKRLTRSECVRLLLNAGSSSVIRNFASTAEEEPFRVLPKVQKIADLKLNESALFQKTIPFLRCTSSSSQKGMSITELCGHSAFVLLGWSYVVDDPFLLRCLATASFTAQICFQFFREKPLWLPIRWNVLFVLVNLIWISKMLEESSEKSLKDLSVEEREFYDAFFKVMERERTDMLTQTMIEKTSDENGNNAHVTKQTRTFRTHQIHPNDFREFLKLGEWKLVKGGDILAVKGAVNKKIYAVCEGAATLFTDGIPTKRTKNNSHNNSDNMLKRGKFIGEMALSHGAAFGTVVVDAGGAKVTEWDVKKLREFVMNNPRAMNSIQASFGRSLMAKMKIVGMES